MADETTAPAGAPAAAPETATPPPAGAATPPAPPPAPEPPLADLIRQEREARAATAREAARVSERDKELETLRAKVKAYEGEKDDIVLDPVGYFSARGLEPKDLAVVTEALAYHLVPEKADVAHRARMVEAQMKRERVLRERRETAAQEKARTDAEAAEQAAAVQAIRQYAETIDSTAKSWAAPAEGSPAPFPVSQEWFTDDHQNYVASLVATARNLAEEAQAKGGVADLSPRNVARVLEEHLTKKVSRASKKTAPQTGTTTQTPPGAPSTPPAGGRKPQAAKQDPHAAEKERVARAAEVAFRTT